MWRRDFRHDSLGVDHGWKNASKVRQPWNKGKLVGQKAAFKPKEIWSIRVRLHMSERRRDLALFNLGIDSKQRACYLTALRVRDICWNSQNLVDRNICLVIPSERPPWPPS
jgi:hypothetical protein